MEMFIGLNIFLLLMAIGAFAIWVWALIDIISSKFKEDVMQVIWLLIVFFLPFIGVLIYLIIGRSMKQDPIIDNGTEQKYDHLGKLKALLDEGVITQEEFESEKEKILSR